MSRSGPPPRQGRIRGAGEKTSRGASSRATKAFYPALSMCDMIFSGVFERHPRLRLAIVEFELAWAPNVLTSMDYTYRERHGEAIYRFKGLPSRRRRTACSRATLPPQRRLELPAGRHRHPPAPTLPSPACGGGSGWGRRRHDVGLGLSAQRVDL